MKKIITLFVCLIAFVGFSKADDDQPITVNQLPQKAQAFINQYFAKKEISLAKVEKDFWDKKYEVVFVNGDKLEFDKNGNWEEVNCNFSEVPADIIPKPIKENIAKMYPKAKVLKIDRDSRGYEVKLNNRIELEYNTEFQLIDIED